MAASLSEVSTREVLHVSRLILSTKEEMLPEPEDSWMTPLIKFIVSNELPEDKARAQKTKRQALSPATLMKPIWASCLFDQWGMDIVGPFPIVRAQKKFLLVAVDYFSKWVEAEPLEKITEQEGQGITSWCKKMKITQSFTSVAYPQANGQTEVVNRIIVQALKTRLQVLPVEIGQTSSRVESYPGNNDPARAMELDLVEEKRDRAFIRMEAYRSRFMRSYNKKVRIRDFQVGDLVMKKVNLAGDVEKLEARWERPYKITRRVSSGSFYLEDAQGRSLKRP
ncbi:uncharacterized protein LOC142504657 [Primulina tabacum]|uniref:uncharacterized protein LOC142504657 n=1 Tax=Primulina tabacum TaxID=48773 RepID=UPI003F5AAF6F